MNDPKQIIAKLEVIENMATEASVKQLCQVMKEYVKDNDKTQLGFTADSKPKKEEK